MLHPCPRCEKKFKTPATLANHAKNKCPAVAEAKAAGSELERHVFAARNIMRSVGLTGMESLDTLVSLFALREVERLFPRLGDPATFELPKPSALCRVSAEVRMTIVASGFVKFSKITATPFDDGAQRDWARLIRNALDALEYHPDTREVCRPLYEESAKLFPLTNSAIAHNLARYVRDNLAFDVTGDTAGRAYMSIVRGFLDGKELGQFFTPSPVVDFLTRRAGEGRQLGRVFDPTCGSGGFLAAAAKAGAAVHGCEIDIRVRLLGYFSALAAGAAAPSVVRADFLRGPITGAPFDTILANPPFGVKGIDYAEITEVKINADGLEIFPLKSSATGFFLQRIVHTLRIGGRGCVVLPLGKELASRAPAEVKFRRALLRAVAVCEIVAIPAGAFENTGIRTVAIVFDKIRDLGTCVTRRKAGKGYTFDLTAEIADMPTDIRLTQLRTSADGKTVLSETELIPGTQPSITLELLEAHGWSLSPDDYKIDASPTIIGVAHGGEPAYPMVSLGELLTLTKGKIQSTKVVPGAFPVISIGLGKTHNEKTDDGEVLVINTVYSGGFGSVGLRIHYHEGPCAITNIVGRLQAIRADTIHLKYAKYILESMIPTLNTQCEKGLANKTLDQVKFFAVTIPLPPIDIQRAIASELDAQAADIAALEKAAAAAERAKKIALDNALYKWGYLGRTLRGCDELADGVRRVRLGELCEIKGGKSITRALLIPGPYPVIGGGMTPMGMHSEYNTEANITLLSATGASCGWLSRYAMKVFRSADCLCLEANPQIVDATYLHYVLACAYLSAIQTFRTGMAQPHLDKTKLANLEVAIPPLETQRAIAAEVTSLDATAIGLATVMARARTSMKVTLSRALSTNVEEKIQVGGVAISETIPDQEPPDENTDLGIPEDVSPSEVSSADVAPLTLSDDFFAELLGEM